MPTFQSSAKHEHGLPESLGVLLVNLGTPAEPTPAAVRRYLKQFLWDPRVVELPRPLWWLILHGYILRFRPARSARAYRKVWTDEGSPLLLHSRDIATSVGQHLESLDFRQRAAALAHLPTGRWPDDGGESAFSRGIALLKPVSFRLDLLQFGPQRRHFFLPGVVTGSGRRGRIQLGQTD